MADEDNYLIYIFGVIFGPFLLFNTWKNCQHPNNRGTNGRNRNTNTAAAARSHRPPVTSSTTTTTQTSNTIQSREILASMYWGAFEETKNEAVLEASRILPTTSVTEDGSDEESQCIKCDDDGNSVIVHALESARSTRKAKKKQDASDDDDDGSVIGSENHPSTTNSSVIHPRLPSDHNRKDLYGNTVRGNCLICLEDLQPGEPVVWSMNEDCPHIFHKDCMVTFLSTKHWTMLEQRARRCQQPKEQNNPCPICRMPFLTVPALESKPTIAVATTARTASTTRTAPTATTLTPVGVRNNRDQWDFR